MRAGIWITIRIGLDSLDADGSIPPEEVVRILSLLEQDDAPDAFFASRCKILGRTVHRSWHRHVMRTPIRDACRRLQPESRSTIHNAVSS